MAKQAVLLLDLKHRQEMKNILLLALTFFALNFSLSAQQKVAGGQRICTHRCTSGTRRSRRPNRLYWWHQYGVYRRRPLRRRLFCRPIGTNATENRHHGRATGRGWPRIPYHLRENLHGVLPHRPQPERLCHRVTHRPLRRAAYSRPIQPLDRWSSRNKRLRQTTHSFPLHWYRHRNRRGRTAGKRQTGRRHAGQRRATGYHQPLRNERSRDDGWRRF